MKLSTPFALVTLLPLVTQVSAGIYPRQFLGGGRNRGSNNGGTGNNTKGATGGTSNGSTNNGTDTASGANGGNNNNSNSTNTGSNGDPQTSLTLDPRVIAQGFANNGQDVPTAGACFLLKR